MRTGSKIILFFFFENSDFSLALTENSTLLRRKKLKIRETTTKIYYPHEDQRAHTLDSKRLKKEQKQRKSMLSETNSLPRYSNFFFDLANMLIVEFCKRSIFDFCKNGLIFKHFRPILKKGPTPFVCHIYEEIEGDYLDPMPGDIRPDVTNFCTDF